MERSRNRHLRPILAGLLLAGLAGAVVGQTPTPASPSPWVQLSRPAGRVIRGHCLSAEPVVAAVGGGRVAATEYTFSVSETLKGPATATLRFRQVGRPEGGRGDLGALVGLPVYRPGAEYVLFLLPEGRAGLTSPVNAAGGAFLVHGDDLVAAGVSHAVVLAPAAGPAAGKPTYSVLRSALRALRSAFRGVQP